MISNIMLYLKKKANVQNSSKKIIF